MKADKQLNHSEILIVEDSPTQLEQLRHFLEEQDYIVRSATNGEEGLESARSHPPAAIISDIVMPEMDGYALCRAIRSDDMLKETPVVLLTSLSSPKDVIEALRCGADNFIRKPYDNRHLLLRLEHILTNRKLRVTDKVNVGVELYLGGDKYFITAERQQILDLLISTYEQAVQLCGELRVREQQVERANTILKGIYSIAKGLNQASTERQVVDSVLARALELPDVSAGWLSLREGESGFRLAGSRGLPPSLEVLGAMEGDCLCRRKALAGEIDKAMNITECERLQRSKGDTRGLHSHVTVPLRIGSRLLGILNLVGTGEVLFSDNDLVVLNGIGNQIGAALERTRVHEHLEELVKERTAELRESELRFRTVFKSQKDAVFVISMDRRVLNMNEAAERMSGYTLENVKAGSTEVFHVDHDHYVQFGERMRAAFSRNESAQFEFRLKRRNGDIFPTEHTVSQLKNDVDEQIGIVSVVRDITERKRAEEERKNLQAQLIQAQKMESIGSLAGGIAHDFNNILGIILGHASILQRASKQPEAIPSSVDAITKAVTRGAGLVRQLLTFSRKADTTTETVRINDLIEELVTMLNETFPKTITIATHLDTQLPATNADANQLHQALLNLAINCRDAMPDGGTLTFSTRREIGEELRRRFPDARYESYLCVTVADAGTGMDEETQRRIFEPFFTTKEVGKGTGLGMSVVYGVVTGHDGIVDFRSTPGKGTTFSLYFPIKQEKEAKRTERTTHSGDAPGGTETILVVEDEEMLRELVSALLSSKGYNVVTAEDGIQAIEQYKAHQNTIALVLSDIGLPRLDGFGLVKALKQKNPKVKFIMASGYIEPKKKEEMTKVGVTEFAQKPYTSDDLLWKVRQVIDRKL
ncbi:MAG: response regulator [Bacteroidota bacterium]